MKSLSQTTQFAKDVKRRRKQGKDLDKLKEVVQKLADGETPSPTHHDHPLQGEWKGSRDCHLEPDWVLIYTTDATSLRLERTGTHADLFE
jgi:mRNA interferase YafQ